MKENELLELGFVPNTDENGKKLSYHPEGVTYKLKNGDFTLSTTDLYNYLWISFKGGFSKLISRKITKERIEKALNFKYPCDIVWLGDD